MYKKKDFSFYFYGNHHETDVGKFHYSNISDLCINIEEIKNIASDSNKIETEKNKTETY